MPLEFQIVVDDKGSAKVQKFSKTVKKSGGASEAASKSLKLFGGGLAIVGAAAVAGGAAIFSLAQKTAEAQDKITKMGRELGVSTEFLSSMQFSAKLAGIELGTVDKGMARLARTALDAQNGSALASRAFDELGVKTKETSGEFKDADKLLFELADKFKAMPDGVMKTAKAQEFFGKSGKQMINLLNQGSEALREQADEASRLGLVFDQEAGENAEKFNDQLLRIEQTFGGFSQEVGGELIPVITELFDDILFGVEEARPAIESFFKMSIKFIEWTVEELSEIILGWANIASEVDSFLDDYGTKIAEVIDTVSDFVPALALVKLGFNALFDDEPEFKIKISPEAQARLERFEKNKKEAEAKEKKAEKIRQANELKSSKKSAQLEKERIRNAEQASVKATRLREREAEKAIREAEKIEKALEDAEKKRIKDAEETAIKIIELNKEISLSLMTETQRSREISKIAHDERIEQGADEFQSKLLMQKEFSSIQAQQEELDREKRNQQMQQVAEGFSQTSQILSNINQVEQQKISERFEKRKEELEATFSDEIKGAEGNAEKQEEIKARRDEALKQLELKKNKAMEQASKKLAGVRKGVAIGEAIMNGALAVTRAFAEGGPIAGPIFAGLATAMTATQVALISQQKFFEGGMIKGKDATMITANENGTESILNARATSAVGENALNDFNSGRTQDALDKIQGSLAGGSGSGLTVNIKGGVVDRKFMEEVLIPRLNKEMRRR